MLEISAANHQIPYSFSPTTPNCLWSFSELFFATPRKPWLRARFARSRPQPRLKRCRMAMMRNLQSRRNPRKRSKRLTHHWMSVHKRRCNSSTHITAMQNSCTVGFEFYLTSSKIHAFQCKCKLPIKKSTMSLNSNANFPFQFKSLNFNPLPIKKARIECLVLV